MFASAECSIANCINCEGIPAKCQQCEDEYELRDDDTCGKSYCYIPYRDDFLGSLVSYHDGFSLQKSLAFTVA